MSRILLLAISGFCRSSQKFLKLRSRNVMSLHVIHHDYDHGLPIMSSNAGHCVNNQEECNKLNTLKVLHFAYAGQTF